MILDSNRKYFKKNLSSRKYLFKPNIKNNRIVFKLRNPLSQ